MNQSINQSINGEPFSSRVQGPEHEADQSLPPTAEVKLRRIFLFFLYGVRFRQRSN